MPESLRDLRRRIRSVANTQKITQAMKMVAAAKLRRAQEKADAARPYGAAIEEVLRALATGATRRTSPFFEEREVVHPGYVVVTGDRGLSGPYNATLLRCAQQAIGERAASARVVAVGRKGRDHFRRRGYAIISELVPVGDEPSYEQARAIGAVVARAYLDGEVDSWELVYTRKISTMHGQAVAERLLPLGPVSGGETRPSASFLFEPSAEEVLALLLPRYIEALIYRALLEAKAMEHAARMMAMDSATRNADTLIRQLTLERNRARQAAITQEIAEIVGGAAALE